MSGSNETSAAAEGEVQPAAGAPAVEPNSAVEAPAGEGGGSESTAAAPSNPPWFTKRIDALTAKLREEERQHIATKQTYSLLKASHEALSAEVGRLRNGATVPAAAAPAASLGQADVDALAEQRASEMLAERAARNAENESAERGKKEYPDFVETVGNIRNLGGIPPATLQMAVETGAAEHILYALGKDLDKAQTIFDMPLGKQAVELAKLALKPGPKAPDTSRAPAPMKPVNGRAATATADLADKTLSMAQWEKVRNEQIAARKAAGRH